MNGTEKNIQIYTDYNNGMKYAEIAKKYGLSVWYIRDKINSLKRRYAELGGIPNEWQQQFSKYTVTWMMINKIDSEEALYKLVDNGGGSMARHMRPHGTVYIGKKSLQEINERIKRPLAFSGKMVSVGTFSNKVGTTWEAKAPQIVYADTLPQKKVVSLKRVEYLETLVAELAKEAGHTDAEIEELLKVAK